MSTHHKASPDGITRKRFPALTAFLQSYFHEDYLQEHGSAGAAAIAFSVDASPAERALVAREWKALLAATSSMSIEQIGDVLTRELGSAWAPSSRESLDEVIAQVGHRE